MRNCVSNKIFIHDVVSGLKGDKSWKRQRTKNCKLFQRKNKIEKICTLRQIQDKAIQLDTGLFF